MNVTFRKSFTRDLKKIRDQKLRQRIADVIVGVESAKSLVDDSDVKKISGADNYYRIRVGDYRIGIILESETVDFVRCLPRRELYKYFP